MKYYYLFKTAQGVLSEMQPIQCFSGKETSLRKFLKCNTVDEKKQKMNREQLVQKMTPIIPDIFNLWEEVETTFAIIG